MRRFFWIFAALVGLSACTQTQVPAPIRTIDVVVPGLEEKPELAVSRPSAHTIQKGETLAKIALDYGLSPGELSEWNGISDPDKIFAGDSLRLSPSPDAPTVSAVHTQTAAAPVAARLSTVIVQPVEAADTASTAAAGGAVPVKNAPLAAKYIYSPGAFKKLRAQWRAQTRQPLIPKPGAPAKPAVVVPAAASAAGAPQKVRRRFNVDWSWPADNKLLAKFNEHSKGIDIAGERGDAVYAIADGKVVYTGTGVKSYGQLVVVKHDNDYLSAYAHNDKVLVKEGRTVKRGQSIAVFGDSGADQVMLHLEIRKAGKPFDPLQVLPPAP